MKSLSRILKPDDVALKQACELAEISSDAIAEREVSMNGHQQFDWKDTEAEREQMLRQARQEAQQIVALANRQAQEQLQQVKATIAAEKQSLENLRTQARDLGYAAGKDEGYTHGVAEGRQVAIDSIQHVVNALRDVINEVREDHAARLEESKVDLLRLAVAVAEKMLCRELNADENFPETVLNSLLPKLDPQSTVSLRVCPATWERWQSDSTVIPLDWKQESGMTIVADESLEPGDIVVDTSWGMVDGRLRRRWQRILEGIDLVEACKGGYSKQ